jgi:hypothetical protein
MNEDVGCSERKKIRIQVGNSNMMSEALVIPKLIKVGRLLAPKVIPILERIAIASRVDSVFKQKPPKVCIKIEYEWKE